MASTSGAGGGKGHQPWEPPKKKPKRLVVFNPEWKNTYPWLKETKDKNKAFCTMCSKEIGIGHGGVNDVKVHKDTDSHRSAASQAGTSKSITSFFAYKKDTAAQARIAAAELTWAYHTNRHALSYRSLDCGVKLCRVTFPDSETVTKMTCGKTKGAALISDVLAPYSVELILSDLDAAHCFYSISSDASNHGNRKMFPLCLKYFTLKDGISNRLLDFYEDANETAENVTRRILDVLAKYQLDLARLSAYSADSANVNFGKYHSVYTLLSRGREDIVPARCPAHIVHNAAKKGCDMLTCDIESLILKAFGHFSVSAKRSEELKEMFEFLEMQGDRLLRHVPTRWLSFLPAINKMLKCWPAVKAYFQKLGEDDCPSMIWRHIDDESGEKDYSTSQTYMMFLQTTLTPIEETVLILERDALTAPELFEAMLRLLNSLKQRKADSFFGTETDKALRKMPPSKARKVKQDFLKFFEKTIAYLEAKFDFSEKNQLCALTPFSLKKSVTYDHLRCAAEQLKMEKIINLDHLYSEYTDAKSLLDEQVACVDPKITVDKKWVAIFSEMGTRSHKCENLLLLVSKILSIPCSNAFVERVFSLMSAHWTETRNRCNVDLVKAELQVKVNFDMDCEQFFHFIKEKKDILKASGKSEKYKISKKEKD